MKITSAWDSVEKENRNLKLLLIALLVVAIFLTLAVTQSATKVPIVVERSCTTKLLEQASAQPTDDELKDFAARAISARFDTKASSLDYLSSFQQGYRAKEQQGLSKQKMRQTVIVNDVKIEKDGLMVDADRLIAVGEIRSTLRFPLRVQLEKVERSEANPYGLLLSEIEQVKPLGKP